MPHRPTVTRSDLSPDSALHDYMAEGDFLDCYTTEATMNARPAAEIIVDFPAWAKFLLRIRRIATTPFGLANDGVPADDKLGPFPVELDTAHEVIAGFDDKHLNFRVSVTAENGKVSLATWVHPHNLGGRIYLTLILPFHILIARNAVARVGMYQA